MTRPKFRGKKQNMFVRNGAKGSGRNISSERNPSKPKTKSDGNFESSLESFSMEGRWVSGLHAVREAIKVRPRAVEEIWLKEGYERVDELQVISEWANGKKIRVKAKPLAALDKITSSHQGICIRVSESPELDLGEIKEETVEKQLLIALDEISDPHNLGAVLRTAWLMGAMGVLVPKNRSAHLSPAVSKVASGAVEHVPLHICDNLLSDLTFLKEKGFWIYGLAGGGAQSLTHTRFNDKVVLVVGAEDKGIRKSTMVACDEMVSIPQFSISSEGASYNASVAAALAIYEVVRQHKNP